jgi:hypothetical protein
LQTTGRLRVPDGQRFASSAFSNGRFELLSHFPQNALWLKGPRRSVMVRSWVREPEEVNSFNFQSFRPH